MTTTEYVLQRGKYMTRRASFRVGLAAIGGGLAVRALSSPAVARVLPADVEAWGAFRERFVENGRVVDTGNGGVSHSEGQGTGLLAAAHTGDRQSFETLYAWTRDTLSRPADHLHAWRYQPNASNHVDDLNNATDGDLLITLALFTAAARWNNPTYHAEAMTMARDIARVLVRQTPYATVLLPGSMGFTDGASVTVNPSYYILPAIRQISMEMPSPIWDRVWNDGLKLLRIARFGQWNLPPDWLTLAPDGKISLAEKWPTRFSFDAVRVPLYMCWGGYAYDPVVDSIEAYWTSQNRDDIPAWIDLAKPVVAPYRQTPGMTAIRQYVNAARTQSFSPKSFPPVSSASDYYSAALILLVQIAVASSEIGAAV
jgi:endoglucanase